MLLAPRYRAQVLAWECRQDSKRPRALLLRAANFYKINRPASAVAGAAMAVKQAE